MLKNSLQHVSNKRDLQDGFREKIHKEVLSLPISPVITIDDAQSIIKLCNSWNAK